MPTGNSQTDANREYIPTHIEYLPLYLITATPLTFTAKPSAEYRAVASLADPLEATPSSLIFRTDLAAKALVVWEC